MALSTHIYRLSVCNISTRFDAGTDAHIECAVGGGSDALNCIFNHILHKGWHLKFSTHAHDSLTIRMAYWIFIKSFGLKITTLNENLNYKNDFFQNKMEMLCVHKTGCIGFGSYIVANKFVWKWFKCTLWWQQFRWFGVCVGWHFLFEMNEQFCVFVVSIAARCHHFKSNPVWN